MMRSTRNGRTSSYDYIIVGGGSAGCVLAARLTETPGVRVLLLEAGPGDRSWRIDMPAAVGSLICSERFNWSYSSEPEPCLDGRRLSHPRGRVLGGSSSINGMVYIRGHALDYDNWARNGAPGWSYADVLPYFIRAERHMGGANAYHGAEGPLAVFAPDLDASPLAAAFVRAAQQAGYPLTKDVNGEQQEGFGRIDRTTWNGRRWSVARAYLRPVADRPGLAIEVDALVHRVMVENEQAVGVEYSPRGGAKHTVRAEAEVLVCGGAINSPQILQLSGIGPADHLRQVGIRPVCDLPGVGAQLIDHPDIVIQHHCRQPISLYKFNRGLGKIITGLNWFVRHEGVAASNHFEAGGFIRSRPGIEFPDLQLTFMPLAIKPGTVQDVGDHSFQVHIDLMRPRSRGRVRIRSAEPTAPPSILFNYLQDSQDRLDLRAAVRLTREILAQPALATFRGAELSPGEHVQSDADIDAYIRQGVETCYHPVGTCRMGLASDCVVDPQCRVHGIAGLRVVDASIMPSIVSGNTNAPTIMIAEKASDLIRGKTALPRSDVPVWIHPQWQTAQR
jgi:choline dehydrogenase